MFGYGGGPVTSTASTTSTTSTTTSDSYVQQPSEEHEGRHIRSGLALNVCQTTVATTRF